MTEGTRAERWAEYRQLRDRVRTWISENPGVDMPPNIVADYDRVVQETMNWIPAPALCHLQALRLSLGSDGRMESLRHGHPPGFLSEGDGLRLGLSEMIDGRRVSYTIDISNPLLPVTARSEYMVRAETGAADATTFHEALIHAITPGRDLDRPTSHPIARVEVLTREPGSEERGRSVDGEQTGAAALSPWHRRIVNNLDCAGT